MDQLPPNTRPRGYSEPLDQPEEPKIENKYAEEDTGMKFMDHVEVLRGHIFRSVIAILIVSVIAFISKDFVFGELVLHPAREDFPTYVFLCRMAELLDAPSLCMHFKLTLQAIGMSTQFVTHFEVSFILGLIVAFPYIFWEFWRFLKPALKEKEQKKIRGTVVVSSILFFLGVLFAYYLIVPFSVAFMVDYKVHESVENVPTLQSYIDFLTGLVLAGGLVFQLPVISFYLAKIGMLTSKFMITYRKYAVVGILFISAIVTPPDWISQVAMSIPLFILYEVSIWVIKIVEKKKVE